MLRKGQLEGDEVEGLSAAEQSLQVGCIITPLTGDGAVQFDRYIRICDKTASYP